VCEGNFEVSLRSELKGWLREDKLLDWRGLLGGGGDGVKHKPMAAYFSLALAGEMPRTSAMTAASYTTKV
jgi:hypothetical protein